MSTGNLRSGKGPQEIARLFLPESQSSSAKAGVPSPAGERQTLLVSGRAFLAQRGPCSKGPDSSAASLPPTAGCSSGATSCAASWPSTTRPASSFGRRSSAGRSRAGGVNQMMPLRPKPPKTLSSLGLTHADAPFSDYPCDSSVSCCAPSDKFRPLRAAARI